MAKSERVVGLDACTATKVDDARVAATRPLLVSAREASGIADVFGLLSDPLDASQDASHGCVVRSAEVRSWAT